MGRLPTQVLPWQHHLHGLPLRLPEVLPLHHCGYAFQPCSSLPYTSIHAIYAVDGRWGKGKFIPSPDIVIHFSDHTRWSEYDWTESNRKILDAGLLEFLTAKTSLQPIPIHLEQDLPQP